MCLKYADYIIKLSNDNKQKLTNTMLQKILFYAYVDYTRKYNKPMFDEDFYAWKNGPVVPMIYDNYNIYQDGVMRESKKEEALTDSSKIIILEDWYKKLINIDINLIIEKTHKCREDAQETPWAKHYSCDLLKILTTDYDRIPYQEIYDYYIDDQNFKYLTDFA